ncbi:MAG: UPF0182 family protein [Candidatus Dormibacteraceae bacterium]
MARRPPQNPFGAPFGPRPAGFEGFGDIHIPRPPRRFWIGLGFVAAAIVLILIANPIVTLITNWEWFSALGFGGAYGTRLLIQVLLFLITLVVAFLFAAANVTVALRLRTSGALRAVGIRHRTLRSRLGVLGLVVSAFLALLVAVSLGGAWSDLVLFLHPQTTGQTDPVLGANIGFYLTQLPFWNDLQGNLVGLLVVTILLVVGLHAWRDNRLDFRLPPRGIVHVSILVGIYALVVAMGAWLSRYGYLYGHDSAVYGAGYADIHARIPLTTVEVFLAVALAIGLFVNAIPRLRQMRLVLFAAGIWVIAVIVVAAYPALIQRLSVQPAELSQETPYLTQQIAGTRAAYGLGGVKTQPYNGSGDVTAQDVNNDQATVNNLRLWDNAPLGDVYDQQQAIRTYYGFDTPQFDRYTIKGTYQEVEISPREMEQSQLPSEAQTWVNQRLVYTHGYGIVASQVAQVDSQGLPQYVAGNIPNSGPLKVKVPQIYFGQAEQSWVVAPSNQPEFDYPSGGASGTVTNRWTGTDAPLLGGPNRWLWSLRTGDLNLLISDQINGQSRILFDRNPEQRLQQVAPFLTADNNPYIVDDGGHLYWIEDGYTSAGTYPYSEPGPEFGANPELGYNYLRNSVKAVINAYTGQTTLYVLTPNDPLIKAYEAAFPSLFKPISAMPTTLRDHLKVPENLFTVQAQMYATYHVSNVATFYNRENVYAQPQGIQPYYVMMRLPGEKQAEFLMILPYTPFNKNNMVAWLAVRQDQPDYGQMIAFQLPKSQVIFGPAQVQSRINQNPELSQEFSLLNQQESKVRKGNLLVVPIDGTFLYFEPWYIESSQGQAIPELKYIILTGSTPSSPVVFDPTLPKAIADLTGQAPPSSSSGTSPPSSGGGTSVSPQVQKLIQQALTDYAAAQNDLKQGDLTGYAQQMQQVDQLLQQIQQLEGGTPAGGGGSGGTAPTPVPSASALPGIGG